MHRFYIFENKIYRTKMKLTTLFALLISLSVFINCKSNSESKEASTDKAAVKTETEEVAPQQADTISQSKQLLIFTKTAGYRHASIEAGVAALDALSRNHDFRVSDTDNADYINFDSLKKFDAVVFLSTTGYILNSLQQKHFKAYINVGGGFIGIHAAADTEYDWPWYGKLVGAYFESHPPGVHKATIRAVDTTHQAMKNVPKAWTHTDEWYNYKSISSDIHVLANLDETTYKGGTNGTEHPIAWVQEYDGGKMFYTGLGHTEEAFKDEHFLAHLLGGIQYVLK